MPSGRKGGKWWEPKSGSTELQVNDETVRTVRADDEARRDLLLSIQALADNIRTEVASGQGLSLADYDAAVQDELDVLLDRIDYYDYSNRTESITVKDGAWFSPIAVVTDAGHQVCGEEVGNEAVLAIDEVNSTRWEHNQDHQHEITFELRGYPKKVSKIRFRIGSSVPAKEQLENFEVRASKVLNKIDDPENVLESGISLVWASGWNEHTLAKSKASCRYIKLVVPSTANANNSIQLREFEVWVETRKAGE